MSRFVARLIAAAAVLLLPAALPAQISRPSAVETEVRQVVDRLFDAMRGGDSAAMRPLFHPEARLVSVGRRAGAPVLQEEEIGGFLAAVGTPRPEVLDERISDVEIRIDGDLATAWMQYAFYLGDRFSHCGVNAFQLFRSAAGWQILQIADTRRRDGCPQAG